MVKFGGSGRAHRAVPTPAKPTSIETATNRCRFGFFCFCSCPPLYFFVSFSAWKENQEQAVNRWPLHLGHSVVGGRKKSFENLWRSSVLPNMIMKTSARRGSLEGLLLCRHLCDEMVVDEEPSEHAWLFRSGCRWRTGKTQSLLPKKGRLSSEKLDTWPQGKTFAGLLCNRARAKRKLTIN